jgi:hypothetical protein
MLTKELIRKVIYVIGGLYWFYDKDKESLTSITFEKLYNLITSKIETDKEKKILSKHFFIIEPELEDILNVLYDCKVIGLSESFGSKVISFTLNYMSNPEFGLHKIIDLDIEFKNDTIKYQIDEKKSVVKTILKVFR